MDLNKLLTDSMEAMGLTVGEAQTAQFMKYKELLLEWNERMNLTAITGEEDIIIKHFVDSVSILGSVEIPEGATVIDVGTGAGFPGIPIKILRPDIKLTLLDSLNKRIGFLNEVCQQLGLKNVDNIHMRAEDGGQSPRLREQFDCCISRAVANLAVLGEYCLPFVKVGGQFIALKGPNVEDEIDESEIAVETLGGAVTEVITVEIPNSDIIHTLVVIDKDEPTPKKFPRKAGTAAKKPIQ